MGLLRRFAPRNDRKLPRLGVFVQTLNREKKANILNHKGKTILGKTIGRLGSHAFSRRCAVACGFSKITISWCSIEAQSVFP